MSRKSGALILRAIEKKLPPATRPDSLSEATTSLWDLFGSCWTLEPVNRPNVESVMKSHRHWHDAFSSTTTHLAGGPLNSSTFDSEDTEVSAAGISTSLGNADPLFPARYALLYPLIAALVECRQIRSQCYPGYTAEVSRSEDDICRLIILQYQSGKTEPRIY
jgi:hypothetical protein